MKPRRILASTIASLLLGALPLPAQTYTFPGNETFSDPLAWNFGAGPVPASDSTLALNFLSFGTGAITVADDLNLTLNSINLLTNGTGVLMLSNTLNGNYAFAGGAAAQERAG